MKRRIFSFKNSLSGMLALGLGFLPSISSAHPGHYHPPGEDDEFDAFSHAVQSLPGWQGLVLATAIIAVVAFVIRRNNTTPAI